MRGLSRLVVLQVALALLVPAAGSCWAETQWPSLFRYTLSLSTDETARYQTSAAVSGPIGEEFSAKLEGWWIGGEGDDRAFLGDAYVDFDRRPLYLAAGRKYVVFGPAGVLVSPGFFGGEARLITDRLTLQAISGSLQFTPGTGTTRFTYTGNRVPGEEDLTAARLGVVLTKPEAKVPVNLGINWIEVLDEEGMSTDAEIGVTKWLSLYGEAAEYDDVDAHVYGVRLSDAGMRSDGKAWIFVFYHREVDVGFVPAAVGASSYFEGQDGWVGGLYYQMNPRHAIGVYGDDEEAILTWFGNIPM